MPMALCEVMLNKGDIPQRADHRRLPTNGLPGNQGNQCFLEGNSGHHIYTCPAKAMRLRDCIRYPNAFRDPGFKDFPLHPSCRRGLFAIREEDPSPAVDCSRWVGERRRGVIGVNQSQFKSWLSQTGSYVTWGGRLQILHEDHKSERLLSIYYGPVTVLTALRALSSLIGCLLSYRQQYLLSSFATWVGELTNRRSKWACTQRASHGRQFALQPRPAITLLIVVITAPIHSVFAMCTQSVRHYST